MFTIRFIKILTLAVLLVLFNIQVGHSEVADNTASNSSVQSAKQLVEEFQTTLIDVMKNGQNLAYQGRYDKLFPAIMRSHDLTKIARSVVGKEWENLTEKQQTDLVDVFVRLSVASYAHNFKSYSGESFKFDSEEQTSRGGIVIHSSLLIPDGKAVRFDYMLKEKNNGWAIINIIADGVSDLALKRSEYTSILQRQGFDALISQINEKIAQYAKS